MISLKKVLTVARYEFTTTVMRKSFLLIALGMPLIIVGSGMVGALMSTRQLKPSLTQTIAVVDQAKILKPGLLSASEKENPPADKDSFLSVEQNNVKFAPYADIDRALDALLKEEVSACYLIEADYLT